MLYQYQPYCLESIILSESYLHSRKYPQYKTNVIRLLHIGYLKSDKTFAIYIGIGRYLKLCIYPSFSCKKEPEFKKMFKKIISICQKRHNNPSYLKFQRKQKSTHLKVSTTDGNGSHVRMCQAQLLLGEVLYISQGLQLALMQDAGNPFSYFERSTET